MRALVVGAGISGLTSAIGLARAGHEVVVVERAPGPRSQGYMIDFFGPGYDAAEELGVLPRILAEGHRVSEVAYIDGRGHRRAGLSFASFGRVVDGRVVSVLRSDLERVLRDAVPDGVEVRYGVSPTAIESGPDAAQVVLDDGVAERWDLVVGADGLHSTVRRLVWGPDDRFIRPLGFHTAAYFVDDPALRRRVGDRFALTDTLDRMVGSYGVGGGRVASFFVHRTDEPLPADAGAALRRHYDGLGWIVPDLLARIPPDADLYYDLVAQSEVPRWHRGRVVLVGDACHAVSLLAGQGASLGLAGARLLTQRIGTADLADALRSYEAEWRPRVSATQARARKSIGWFLPSRSWQRSARRLVLRASGLPFAERLIAGRVGGKG